MNETKEMMEILSKNKRKVQRQIVNKSKRKALDVLCSIWMCIFTLVILSTIFLVYA